MNLLLLNQYYAPDEAATAQILSDVGAGLVQAGWDVRAVCSRRAYAFPERRYPSRETIDGVKVERVWATAFGRGSKLGRLIDYATFLCGAMIRLLFGATPDVVICLSTPPMVAAAGLAAARLRGARVVFWVMDVYPELAFELGILRPGSLAARVLGWTARSILVRSDRVVALGETMAERLRQAAPGRQVDVVHNWADGEVIRPRPIADHPLRREWGWEGRFVVLYSGNLGLAHEFETALAAADRLQDRPDVLFAFVGGGPRLAEVRAAVEQRGLANVEFRPYVERERLGESLTAADVHLVTLRPGLAGLLVPSKIYGILAAGRPTLYVGPAEGEIADIVREGDCGHVVTTGDVDALVAAVESYRSDASAAGERGGRARELFDTRYSLERGVGRFVSLVKQLHSD